MNRGNNKPLFVMSTILLVVGIFGIGSTTLLSQTFAQDNDNTLYSTVLSGDQEVPPVDTQATGIADFTVGGDNVDYTINATDIEGVTAGHIHYGIEGENGPVVATLFDFDSPRSEVSESGTITGDDLSGSLEGMKISDLVNAMNDGNTYANMHTEQNPNGEIRGQIISEDLQMDTEEQ